MAKTKVMLSMETVINGSNSFIGETVIPPELAIKIEYLMYKNPRKHKTLLKKWVVELNKLLKELD